MPGSTVVGSLKDIIPWQAEFILSLRLCLDSPEGRTKVLDGFSQCFGEVEGRAQMQLFEMFLTRLHGTARRPLVRHGLGCTCLGSDEAALRFLCTKRPKAIWRRRR